MNKFNFEKPEVVFTRVPQIENICLEFGVDRSDVKTITCMYEVFKRVNDKEYVGWDDEAYDEGYKEGYNAAIVEAEGLADSLSWEIGRLKKE